jgi:hypothetical protein
MKRPRIRGGVGIGLRDCRVDTPEFDWSRLTASTLSNCVELIVVIRGADLYLLHFTLLVLVLLLIGVFSCVVLREGRVPTVFDLLFVHLFFFQLG